MTQQLQNKFPVEELRSYFPALQEASDAAPIRFDSPAGTLVPESVALAVCDALQRGNANVHGFFDASKHSTKIVSEAHAAMADFLGAASPAEVIFGPSMTALTFALSRCVGRDLQAGDEIVVTSMDHDANIAPWTALADDRGLTVRTVPFDPTTWRVEPEQLSQKLSTNTRVVAVTAASNVTGAVNDIPALAALVHAAGAILFVDAVQYAPHLPLDVAALNCDVLVCSAYKFYGPHVGVAWARASLLENLFAYKVRPAKSDLPWKFEPGVPQIELQRGVQATVDYLERVGEPFASKDANRRERIAAAFSAVSEWENQLCRQLIVSLRDMPNVRVIGPTDAGTPRIPVVSFLVEGLSAANVARSLANKNICVWSGSHYAVGTMSALGIDEHDGVVRAGLAHYNTPVEVERLLQELHDITTTKNRSTTD